MHEGHARGDVGAGIEPGRGVGAGDLVVVRAARHLFALMDQRLELPVIIGGEPHVVARLGAVGGDREALVAGGDQLDRPVEAPRRGRDQRRALGHRAARAEGAADERRYDADLVGV